MMNNRHRKHYPAEIFGYPVENKSKEAEQVRKRHLCPFSDKDICSKQSRLLTYPMGICSTWWPNSSPIAICPEIIDELPRLTLENIEAVVEYEKMSSTFPAR